MQTERRYYFLEETSFSSNNGPLLFHSDTLIWYCIVALSSKVSHSNYTLVKTYRLCSSDICTLCSLVGWYAGKVWCLFFLWSVCLTSKKMHWNLLGWPPTLLFVSIVSATAVLFDFRFISRVQLWIAAYNTTDDSPIFHYSFWQMLKLVLLSDTNSCHNVFIFFLKQCKAVITFKVTAISHCIGGIWQGFLFYLLSSNTIYLIQSSPLTDQIMLYTYFSQIYALLLLFIQDFLLLYPTFTVSIFTKLELSLGL